MTKLLSSLCGAVLAISVVACGGASAPSTPQGLCDKAGTVAANVQAKIAPCLSSLPPGTDVGIPTGATCTNGLANCSEADRGVINSTLDCLNGLPNCSSSNLEAFGNAAAACDPSARLSAACNAAFGG